MLMALQQGIGHNAAASQQGVRCNADGIAGVLAAMLMASQQGG